MNLALGIRRGWGITMRDPFVKDIFILASLFSQYMHISIFLESDHGGCGRVKEKARGLVCHRR
jgi:hypothetical protein